MYIKITDWGSTGSPTNDSTNEDCEESPEDQFGIEYILGSQGVWKVKNTRRFFLKIIQYGIQYMEIKNFDFYWIR